LYLDLKYGNILLTITKGWGGFMGVGFVYFYSFIIISILIVFIVICTVSIVLSRKLAKEKEKSFEQLNFLYQLYQSGRISAEEYTSVSKNNATAQGCYNQSTEYSQQSTPRYAQPMPRQQPQPQPQQMQEPQRTQSPQPVQQPQVQQVQQPYYQQTVEVKKEKKPLNTLNLIFMLGVGFIILAGLIFVTTTWAILSDTLKIVSVGSFTALFFVISTVAEKKLKLIKTASAFFTLGAVFLPIDVLGLGFFKLLGEWLSVHSDGKYMLGFIAFALLLVASFIGTIKFKSDFFAWACLSSITISFSFLLSSIFNQKDFVWLFLSVFSVAIVFFQSKLSEIAKQRDSGDAFRIILSKAKTFSIINISIISFLATIFSGFSVLTGFSIVIMGTAFLASTFNSEKSNTGVFLFFPLLVIGCLKPSFEGQFSNSLMATTIALIAILGVSFFDILNERMKKSLQIGSLILGLFIFTLNISNSIATEWNATKLATAILIFICFMYLSIKDKNKLALYFQPIMLISIFSGITAMLDINDSIAISVLCLVAFVFYYFFKIERQSVSLRTPASDGLFLLTSLISGLVQYDAATFFDQATTTINSDRSIISFAVVCIILMILTFGKIETLTSKIASYFLAPSLALLTLSISRRIEIAYPQAYLNNGIEKSFLIFFIIFSIASIIGLVYKQKFTRLKRADKPFLWSMIAIGTIMSITQVDIQFKLSPISIWLLTIYLATRFIVYNRIESAENKPKRNFLFYSAGVLFHLSVFYTAFELLPRRIIMFGEFEQTVVNWHLVILATVCVPVILYAVSAFHRYIKKIDTSYILKGLRNLSKTTLLVIVPILSSMFTYDSFGKMTYEIPMYFSAICLVLIAFATVVVYIEKSKSLSLIVLAFIYPIVAGISERVFANSKTFEIQQNSTLLVVSATFVVMLLLGRLLNKMAIQTVNIDGNNTTEIDWFSLVNFIAPIQMLFSDNSNWIFIGWLGLAVFVIQFWNRLEYEKSNQTILTITGVFLIFAWWAQPFSEIPTLIEVEFALIPIIIYCFLLRFVWRGYKKITDTFLYVSTTISMAILTVELIRNSPAYYTSRQNHSVMGDELYDFIIIAGISIALLAFSILKKRTNWFLTSGIAMCFMFWYQPFGDIKEVLYLEYRLIPVILLTAGLVYVAKSRKKLAKDFQFAVCSICSGILFFNAVYTQKIEDALILGTAMLILLAVSFSLKLKTWLALSIVSLIAITLYTTREFWFSLPWWLYLLVVGVSLIVLAALNETKKQKTRNSSIKQRQDDDEKQDDQE